jgi:hypothetical protein
VSQLCFLSDAYVHGRSLTFQPVTRVAKVPARLQTLVQCRDGPHCSLIEASGHHDSGQAESAYIIPPGILECPDDLRIQRPLFSLFEIFLTPSKVSRLRAMLLDESDQGVHKNLWLLSPSIHSAFRGGHLKVQSRFKAKWDKDDEWDTAEATEARVCCISLCNSKAKKWLIPSPLLQYSIVKLYPEECGGLSLMTNHHSINSSIDLHYALLIRITCPCLADFYSAFTTALLPHYTCSPSRTRSQEAGHVELQVCTSNPLT